MHLPPLYGAEWFHDVELIFFILCALASAAVSYFAYRSYKVTEKKQYLMLFGAFLLVFVGWIGRFAIYFSLNENIFPEETFLYLSYLHMGISFLVLVAYSLLLFLYLKIDDQYRAFIFTVIMLVLVFFAFKYFTGFNSLSAVIWAVLFYKTTLNYLEKKKLPALLTASSFGLIFAGYLTLALIYIFGRPYMLGVTLIFLGYSLLAYSLYRVFARGR
ncbi:hypothetical protein JXB01_01450 [Candidatus Micrarchaeota archaeon]|nr:hypothetical protein [Candidatus Micrarchaeota archaeon]